MNVEIKKDKKKMEAFIEGLEAGQTYLIRIKAVNPHGQGPSSKPAKVTTFHEETGEEIQLLKTMTSAKLNEMKFVGKIQIFDCKFVELDFRKEKMVFCSQRSFLVW